MLKISFLFKFVLFDFVGFLRCETWEFFLLKYVEILSFLKYIYYICETL